MQRMNDLGAIEPGRTDCDSSWTYIDTRSKLSIKHKTPLVRALFVYYMQFVIASGRRQIGYSKTMFML